MMVLHAAPREQGMQDWSNENQKAGRPAPSFGRRNAANGPYPSSANPAVGPAVAPPAVPLSTPSPSAPPLTPTMPRVPLSTISPAQNPPAAPVQSHPAESPSSAPLPISSQQLQLFTGPM